MGDEQLARARADLAAGGWLDDIAAEYNLTGEEIVVLIRERLDSTTDGFRETHDGH